MTQNKDRRARIACIISLAAVIASALNVILSATSGEPLWPSITIFCCITAVLLVNIFNCSKNKGNKK